MGSTGGRTLSWIEVLVRMVHGPTPTLRGTIRSEVAAFDPDAAPGVRVWRDGRVATISDDDSAWSFDDDHDAPPIRPRGELLFGGGSHWVGDDVTRSTGPVQKTTFLNCSAWAVELALSTWTGPIRSHADDQRAGVAAAFGRRG